MLFIYMYYIVFAAARTQLKRAATVKHHVHYALYIACGIMAYWAANTDPVRRFKNPENYFGASGFIYLHNR